MPIIEIVGCVVNCMESCSKNWCQSARHDRNDTVLLRIHTFSPEGVLDMLPRGAPTLVPSFTMYSQQSSGMCVRYWDDRILKVFTAYAALTGICIYLPTKSKQETKIYMVRYVTRQLHWGRLSHLASQRKADCISSMWHTCSESCDFAGLIIAEDNCCICVETRTHVHVVWSQRTCINLQQ